MVDWDDRMVGTGLQALTGVDSLLKGAMEVERWQKRYGSPRMS
jgi:hypothetical protein